MQPPPIPFYGNPDNTHCFQATIRMVLKHYFPDEDYTWDQLATLTGKKPDKWTWRCRGLVELHNRGMQVINWTLFDYDAFVARGADYLFEFFGPDKARIQIDHCDLEYEIENARQMQQSIDSRRGLPTLEDVGQLLDAKYLVICNVNSKALNSEEGYAGHFVLVYGLDEEHVLMHDPGPPHAPERKVAREVFLRAWEYPTEKQRNLVGVRELAESSGLAPRALGTKTAETKT